MNILILGGNGFIGSHLVDKYIAEGHKVRVFDKYEEHFRKPISSVDYRFGDFGNRRALEDALDNINILYHLIWTSLPKTSNDDPLFDVQSNVIETLNLLEKCVEKNIYKFVFISSGGTVYGNQQASPIPELSQTSPECSYGITKLMIEKYLFLYHKLYGLDYLIARPSNPYGPRQNPDGIQGIIPIFLGKIINNIAIEIWGDGGIVRDYIYIDDLIDGLYKASMSDSSHKIFNFGSGNGYSINNLIDIMRDVTGKNITIEYKEKRIFDIPNIYLDISRAKRELNWSPRISISVGIEKVWKFIKDKNNEQLIL